MNEALAVLFNYVRMLWRFRWVALIVSTLVCVAGWAWVIVTPNIYEVTAKVYLDTRSLMRPVLKGIAVEGTGVQESATLLMRRTLLVRSNLMEVARKTDMDLRAKTPEALDALLARMALNIKIAGTGRDNIFTISYRNKDPQLADRVVEALLNIFIEKSLGSSRQDTGDTRRFIDRQLQDYANRLNRAENRLAAFKQRNYAVMPSEGSTYFGELQKARAQLAKAKLELAEAVQRRDALQSQIAGDQPVFGITPPPPPVPAETDTAPITTEYDARIAALENKLDLMRLQYTDKYPDVIAAKQLLADLRARRRKEVAKLRRVAARQAAAAQAAQQASAAQTASYNLDQSPLYMDLKSKLATAQSDVAALTVRVAAFKKREAKLEKLVDTIPKVEAELQRLNRDYAVNKANYEQLLKRREALRIGEDASQATNSVQFNVIEPPRVPLIPVSPKRPRLTVVVLFFGLAAGVGAALLIGMLRPAVYVRDDLSAIGDYPVYGSVSRIWTPRLRFKRRIEVATFGLGCSALATVWMALLVLQIQNYDLLAKAKDLVGRFL